MKILIQILILLSAVAFVVGSVTAFLGNQLYIPPAGYWRGTVALLLFALTLLLYQRTYKK